LRQLDTLLHGRVNTIASNMDNVAAAVAAADLVIGAVLVPGAKAPKIVTESMIASMRSGAVVVDVAIDQGGCIATARPTKHSDPTYVVHGVVHYCVTNMPGAVPRTSTIGLSNATLPYGLLLADHGLRNAVDHDAALAHGVNVLDGKVTYPAVAAAFDLEYTPLPDALPAALAETRS
jgi:alanine dehydrogenase